MLSSILEDLIINGSFELKLQFAMERFEAFPE